MGMEKKDTPAVDANATEKHINQMVDNATKALEQYMTLTQEQIDKIVHAMVIAGLDNHMHLSKMAVEETGRGVFEDKVIKNIFSTEYIYNDIKDLKTVGVVTENTAENYIEIAEPVGVVAGVTPTTNPTSTTLFKSIICAKTRNPIIFAFHPSAQKCSLEAAKIVADAAVANGAPKYCIQWIETPSIEATGKLINHNGVSLILATGGPGMVKAAYSAGKPALGVGSGNVPCYIHKSANIRQACTDLMISKTFDNGMVCSSEQAVIVDKKIVPEFERYLKEHNCYFLNAEETKKVEAYVIDTSKGFPSVKAEPVGQTANFIAQKAGIVVPEKTKILLAKLPEPSLKYPLSLETLMPLLAYFVVDSVEQGIDYCKKMLQLGGMGHSAVIHSYDKDVNLAFAHAMQAGRVLVNSPSSHGAIGGIYNIHTPSLTLGCGSYGRNSTTANVSSVNLINKKRISNRRNNMQWFKIPPKIFFENNSIGYLEVMANIKRAMIVTDPMMVQLGYVKKIEYFLNKRKDPVDIQIFSDVEPDPSVDTVMRGVDAMNKFKPDVIIALGGGSPMDAAKAMWLFYEHPDTKFSDLKQKFLDIRKRAVKFPNLGDKAKFVAVPTTSGTGSEVTSFTVITDKKTGNKYPLADYELTPNVAIIDPQFVQSLPRSVAADTGMDVLAHAVESYVSVMANDYTDPLALSAVKTVFEYLEKSYNGDEQAREKMHNASTIAGMAFTNAFLGINHSLAHKLGNAFNIPHGRANAILLPHVIAYNAEKPEKFPSFPKANVFKAEQRYAEIAKFVGIEGKTDMELVANFIKAVKNLAKKINIPMSVKECGIAEKDYRAKIKDLAYKAFEDQCTTANPRYPLVVDIEKIYNDIY